jgi:hypothetical protein
MSLFVTLCEGLIIDNQAIVSSRSKTIQVGDMGNAI